MVQLSDAIRSIEDKIRCVAEKCGRDPNEIRIVAVTKTHPPEAVREAFAAGMRVFGENRIQEAESKISALEDLPAEWHLIGHLQTNKVKKAISLFSLIHSVDSVKVIESLEREGALRDRRIAVLLQLNLSGEESKFGASSSELEILLAALQKAPHIQCRGLMTIPPFEEDPEIVRPFFRQLRKLGEQYRHDLVGRAERLELSMGMTGDYPVAIEEGATFVRIGTAIFGNR